MSITVWLAANSLDYPQGGGHRWVYINWALGLRALGCQVVWLEAVKPNTRDSLAHAQTSALKQHLEPYGLADHVALCTKSGEPLPRALAREGALMESAGEADLLLNMAYDLPSALLRRFRRTALIDIDPGLTQVWMSLGRLKVARHDAYFTIGETVGTPAALFPDCDLPWQYAPPVVFLPVWSPTPTSATAPYTTISDWWGEWLVVDGESFDNSKRITFLEYADFPSRTSAALELALCLGGGDDDEREMLEERGWRIRHAWDVSSTPEQYQTYIQGSRGEFSCAKPSCMRLQNAWISDRTLCYLASGKPAVVQHTGPSRFLPDAEGLFRFQSEEEAGRALGAAEADYDRHAQAARALVEEYFSAEKVVGSVLERALG